MRVRWIGLVCALAAVAGLLGYQYGERSRPEPTTYGGASPVAAVSPSIPVETVAPFAPDIDYPVLEPDLDYRTQKIGQPGYLWTYAVPRGWTSELVDGSPLEVRWRPAGEPTIGGYSMRVKIVNAHLTNQQMVDQKRDAVTAAYDDVDVLVQSTDELSFSYRDPDTQRQRFNTFRWFTPTGGATAEFEMSVVGRKDDQPGLEDLFDRVGVSVRKLP